MIPARKVSVLVAGAILSAFLAVPCRAAGEAVNGSPSWAERVLWEWTNRARSDPDFEIAQCNAGAPEPCLEAPACNYSPRHPFSWNVPLAEAARFHADHIDRKSVV